MNSLQIRSFAILQLKNKIKNITKDFYIFKQSPKSLKATKYFFQRLTNTYLRDFRINCESLNI